MRKMGVQTALIEEIDPTFPEISAECTALSIRHDGKSIEIKAFRITFIHKKINSIDEIHEVDEKSFLASVIIINFKIDYNWTSYLFRAIVALPGITTEDGRTLLLNNYIRVFNTFPCEIELSAGVFRKFEITGTYFGQQNNATSVCGHAALCMALNNMTMFNGGMIAPEDINRAIGADHSKQKFGSGVGLSIEDIRKALTNFGLHYTEMDFFANPTIEYNEKVYKYIESGFPVLLIFSTKSELHVVTVLGHTLNTDLWRPEAEFAYTGLVDPADLITYRPAAAWVDHFIINDDNFGMYQCLPVESLKRMTLPKYDTTFRARFAIMVVPSNVTTPAYEAEYASVKVTKDILLRIKGVKNDWLQRILFSDQNGQPSVVRTMLVKREDYVKNLNDIDFTGKSFKSSEKKELIKDLPNFFWLSEITMPDLYTANKTKVIDFFYPSDLPPLQDITDIFKRWLQIRFPEALLKNNGLVVKDMSVSSHYPLFRSYLEKIAPEW